MSAWDAAGSPRGRPGGGFPPEGGGAAAAMQSLAVAHEIVPSGTVVDGTVSAFHVLPPLAVTATAPLVVLDCPAA
jgi:hypothetical protein